MTTMYITRDTGGRTYKWVATQAGNVMFERSRDILRDVKRLQRTCRPQQRLIVVTDCEMLHSTLQFDKGCKLLRPNNGCKQDWFYARIQHVQDTQNSQDATLYYNRKWKPW